MYAYARRRTDTQAAQDIVAETFLVAWRRWYEIGDDPLPWLLVTAGNLVKRHHRTSIDDAKPAQFIGWAMDSAGSDPADTVIDRADAIWALGQLSERDREALLVVCWDGLTSVQAARVMGCSVSAFGVRLHRARQRFLAALDVPQPSPRSQQSPESPTSPKGSL